MTRNRWMPALLGLLVASAVLVGDPQPAAAVPPAPTTPAPAPCERLETAAAALSGEIDAHNARPVDQTDAAAVGAYNAEADALNARADALNARLTTCADLEAAAAQLLGSDSPGDWTYAPTLEEIAVVDAATAGLDRGFTAPGPDGRGVYTVPEELRALHDALRGLVPAAVGPASLQGERRPAAGDPDPAFPGLTIAARDGRPAVGVDAILPLPEIVSMPGFLGLDGGNMLRVVHAPAGLQWLSTRAALAQGSPSVAAVASVDPAFAAAQDELATGVRQRLLDGIQVLLQLQQAGTP